MPLFTGKTALITGAANGQGRATALALAREGANIVAIDVARQLPYPLLTKTWESRHSPRLQSSQ